MVIALGPDLEAALNELAAKQGVDPDALELEALRVRFLKPARRIEPRDEWERLLLSAATDWTLEMSKRGGVKALKRERVPRHSSTL